MLIMLHYCCYKVIVDFDCCIMIMILLAEYIVDGKFSYHQLPMSTSDVHVSAISCAYQISSLLIGYSFGSFVLYNMTDLTISYSSPYSAQRSSPVTHFVYMEPENDPKCFVYVWVARGNQGSSRYVCTLSTLV